MAEPASKKPLRPAVLKSAARKSLASRPATRAKRQCAPKEFRRCGLWLEQREPRRRAALQGASGCCLRLLFARQAQEPQTGLNSQAYFDVLDRHGLPNLRSRACFPGCPQAWVIQLATPHRLRQSKPI